MAEVIKAQARAKAGKGASRAIRRENLIPGVVYGGGKESVLFAMDPREITAILKKPGVFTRQFELDVEGAGKENVMCKEIQTHPVTDAFMHIDFARVAATDVIMVKVPIILDNADRAVGLKKGGSLNLVHRTVKVVGKAASIPHVLHVDVKGLDVGDSITTAAVELSGEVKFAHGWDNETIVNLTGRRASSKADDAAAAPATAPAAEKKEAAKPAK